MRFATACLVALLGAASVHAADSFRPPGRLIDVGGHKVHLYCTGKKVSPTVVMIAGASSFSIDFALVQPVLSRTSRVCAFDRAGYAWSEPYGVLDDHEQVIRDLRAALMKAGERQGYVLVGQSMGSRFARLYYAQHPTDVAGMVLIDGEHEDGLFILANGKPAAISSLSDAEFTAATPPASAPPQRVPVARLEPAYEKLPTRLQQEHLWLMTRLFDGMRAAPAADVDAFQKKSHTSLLTLHQIDAAPHPLGDLPLIVLSAGRNDGNLHRRLQMDLARMSTNSRLVVVDDSDHEIHLSRPDVVIRAINDVTQAARTKTKLQ
jgi:pimeloyl-ACP methyl ester carboxylesterase